MLGVDIHADSGQASELGCKYGHLKVALWLYGLGYANTEQAFHFNGVARTIV